MDDTSIITAVAAGDDTAFRELFALHGPWLAGRLRRVLPTDGVEDVLQETFLAIWRGAASYSGEGTLGAWMWGIARRQAALWVRIHYPSVPIAEPWEAGEDPADTAAL